MDFFESLSLSLSLSLPLSLSLSLSFHPWVLSVGPCISSNRNPVPTLKSIIEVLSDWTTLVCLFGVIHKKKKSLKILSFLLQRRTTYLVHLTWMVCEMGAEWLYSWCFLWCCLQDLFKTPRTISGQLRATLFSFLPKHFLEVWVVNPYSSTGTGGIWREFRSIFPKRFQ